LQNDPDFIEAWYSRSLVKFYQKDYANSRKDAFHALSLDENYDDAILVLGDDYSFEARYDSAIFWYEKAYGHGINTAPLFHAMGYVYDQLNEKDKAIDFYQQAVGADSSKFEIYERLSQLDPGNLPTYMNLYNKFKQEH
jgi:tetratricopeptide (TPR) repeat protein